VQHFKAWLADLRTKRKRWVDASHENGFDRGIWNATVEKYADPTHFVFELLQNAEDAGATFARFTLGATKIIFEHDGRPFSRGDIEGITGIGNTTKLDDYQKIGCFGIGFKSIYVVTARPEVHGPVEGRPTAFTIRDLVVPELIPTDHQGPTTRIVLPLAPATADAVTTAVGDTLAQCGAQNLLFLRGLRRLEWSGMQGEGRCVVQDNPSGTRSLRSFASGATAHTERYHVLERPVRREGFDDIFSVKIAFRLNDSGEIIPEVKPTRLSVFFETEEVTGLLFRVHGPFQLTDNRASIKRSDPWNAHLVGELAVLLSNSLLGLRERSLVSRSFLETLPNHSDKLAEPWGRLREATVEAFKQESLVPAQFGGHVRAPEAVRGPADIRDFLRDEGLAAFGRRPGHRWAAGSLRNSRADHFLVGLGMQEWGAGELATAFEKAFDASIYIPANDEERKAAQVWFDSLGDEAVQRFYLLVDGSTRAARRTMPFVMLAFIRMEDGSRASPGNALMPPRGAALDEEAAASGLSLVRNKLLHGTRGKDVEQFLRRAGVKDTSEREYLRVILRAAYGSGGSGPPDSVHLQHMRRILLYFEETRDAGFLKGLRILRAEDEKGYHSGQRIYLDKPYAATGLSAVYDGQIHGRDRRALWSGYSRLPREALLAFLKELGAEHVLEVQRIAIPHTHPERSRLMHSWHGTRVTDSQIDVDFTISQVDQLLARGDATISRLIWDAVTRRGMEVMQARYRPNASYMSRSAPSTLALALQRAKWLPARDRILRRPCDLTEVDLDPAFPVTGNEGWLEAIGFAAEQKRRSAEYQGKRQAARAMGLPEGLADLLAGMSTEEREAFGAEMLRRAAPEFPERTSPNPERRAQRMAERAAAALSKNYETRKRSVRTSDMDARQQARPYLRDLYTNRADEMVCQACHKEMPFRLADGFHYFEAPEFLDDAPSEHTENHLALCPVCSAKWRNARKTSTEELRDAVVAAEEPVVQVCLAGEDVRLRFVGVHLDDLRAIIAGTYADP
jgi:hypothetical protein